MLYNFVLFGKYDDAIMIALCVCNHYLTVTMVIKLRYKNIFTRFCEWAGVVTAIIYSLLVALNIGAEFIGFSLLLISAGLIGMWAFLGKHRGILLLQLFYAAAGMIGMLRWYGG